MRLLIVDDDPFMARQVAFLAQRAQVEAVAVATSYADIANENLSKFNIVILDLMMPDMDGVEWMRRFAQLGISMRLILLTGLADDVVDLASQTALGYGHRVLGSLRKPIRSGDLEYLLAVAEEVACSPRRGQSGAPSRGLASSVEQALDSGRFDLRFEPQLGLASDSWFGVKITASLDQQLETHFPDSVGLLAEIDTPRTFVPSTLLLVERGLKATARLCASADFRGLVTVDVLPAAIAQPDFTTRVLELMAQWAEGSMRLNLHLDGVEPNHARIAVQDAQARLAMHGVMVSSDKLFAGSGHLFVLDDAVTRCLQHADKVRKLVRVQIQMCHDVGMIVLAQGVDDAWTGRWLAEAGCDVAEGAWVAAPMPFGAVAAWARQRTGGLARMATGSGD